MSLPALRAFALRHRVEVAAELDERWSWEELFEEIEAGGFFARQAAGLDGFRQTSRDLERYVLPATLRAADWPRLLRFAAIAANLRGLAEDLDDEQILKTLAATGRSALAIELAEQLPGLGERARARAAIATALSPARPEFGRLLDAVREDLEAIPRPTDPTSARRWRDTLVGAARCLAYPLQARWQDWIRSLEPWPELADDVRRELVESLLKLGEADSPILWRALGGVRSPRLVAELVTGSVAPRWPGDPLALGRRVREGLPSGGAGLAWAATIAALAGHGLCRPALATERWKRARRGFGPVPWSRQILELGAELWSLLGEQERSALESELPAELRFPLRVLLLERRGKSAASAVASIRAVDPPASELHWRLRWLAAPGAGTVESRTRGVGALKTELQRSGYAAPAADLARFLDLVAELRPDLLPGELEAVSSAAGSGASTLEAIAGEVRHPRVRRRLFDDAERLALRCASTTVEAFALRRALIVRLAGVLCAETGDLEALSSATRRLLPGEEEDDLRAFVARALARHGYREKAGAVTSEIRGRPLRVRTWLEVTNEDVRSRLEPNRLYEAVASVDVLEDEVACLGVLLEVPDSPSELARHLLGSVRSDARRVEALMDLAWHGLRYQERTFRRGLGDRRAPSLPLRQSLGVIASDAWLVALTPDLVDLGMAEGGRLGVAEVQEAIEQAIGLETVPWRYREEAIRQLFARIEAVARPDGDRGLWVHRRRALRLVRWAGRLPRRPGEAPGLRELRGAWPRLLPVLVALVRRGELARGPESERRLVRSLTRGWPCMTAGLFRRSRTSDSSALRASDAELGVSLNLCRASIGERLKAAGAVVEDPGRSGQRADPLLEATVHALCYLLAGERASFVPGLVGSLGPGPSRDDLVFGLLRLDWLPPDEARRLVELLEQPKAERAWLELGILRPGAVSEDEWLEALASLVAAGSLDPSSPSNAPVRRHLWQVDPRRSLPVLAQAVVDALGSAGRPGAENGLRLFLDAWLAPVLGRAGGCEALGRSESAVIVLRQALSLAGSVPSGKDRALNRTSPERAGPGRLGGPQDRRPARPLPR